MSHEKLLKKVLLVEDNPDDARLIERFLLKKSTSPFFDFTIDHAPNLKSATQKIQSSFYDLLLTDLHLPDSVGLDTFRAIRKMGDHPIVVMTSITDQNWAFEALKNGAQDYLVKDDITADNLARSVVYSINRKEAELKSLQEQEKYRKIFLYSHDGILIHNLEGQIIEANPAALGLLDYDANGIYSLQVFHFCGREIFDEQLQKLKKNKYSFFETKLKTNGGQSFPAEVLMAVFDTRKNLVQCVFRDISNRKNLEELKDQFASTVSHEMRTPLAVISGVIENMVDGIEGELTPPQNELLGVASSNLSRLHRIINDLLDLSRLESGIAKINKMNMKPSFIIEEILQSFKKMTVDKELELCAEFEQKDIEAYADPDLVYQVLSNLVNNAVRFTKNKITLSLNVLKKTKDKPKRIRISVTDDGCGIEPELIPQLFNKYFQVGQKTDRKDYKGTGLGLAICHELIKIQEGEIWVESQLNHGAAFHFTLPVYQEETHFEPMIIKDIVEMGAYKTPLVLLMISCATNEQIEPLKNMIQKKILRSPDQFFHQQKKGRFFILARTNTEGAHALCKRVFSEAKKIDLHNNLTIQLASYPRDTQELKDLLFKTYQALPLTFKNRKTFFSD